MILNKERKMKKNLLVLISIVMVAAIALTACGGAATEAPAAATQAPAAAIPHPE